ncbi:hypothetical protein ACIGMX_41415 [Streptomyces aquilus]|uniref:hypothetical protein n=1 Tax=Streptomyces aquilus TaxID=2548456 RepID=UPI00104A0152
MLDLTVRALAWMLSICTAHPNGRHRLRPTPPLRFTPTPPPNLAALLAGTTPADLPPLGIDIGLKHIHGICTPSVIR